MEVLEETIELTTENSVKTAEIGSRIELKCRSNLKPPVAFAWSRDKNNQGIPMGATIRGSTLILPNVNYQDAGIYVCKANNTECVILTNSVIISKPPVDLYLNFEKSSWKNQVQRTGFLACKNQFRN